MAVVLLVLHYAVEFLYHSCKMLHYYGKTQLASSGSVPVTHCAIKAALSLSLSLSLSFRVWQALFVLVRIATVFIAIVTLWSAQSEYGMAVQILSQQVWNRNCVSHRR